MRLFVAIDPPPEAVAHLDGAIGGRDERLRWVPTAQWHLTLVFCGDVDTAAAEDLKQRLARAAARTAPFTVRLAGAGTFPRQPARARVLWVGVDGETAALSRLAERAGAAARRAGIAVEDRSFRAHLTLARARRDSTDVRDLVARLSSYDGPPWPVSSLRLVHSTLGARVDHRTVEEWPLAATE